MVEKEVLHRRLGERGDGGVGDALRLEGVVSGQEGLFVTVGVFGASSPADGNKTATATAGETKDKKQASGGDFF